MTIDLRTVLEKDDYIINYQAKSKIIMNKLIGYDNGYILIISINILNILEMDDRFNHAEYETLLSGDIFKAGDICGFELYVDKFMNRDEILITYNKEKMRDNKLDYLLSDKNLIKEKRVKIIS